MKIKTRDNGKSIFDITNIKKHELGVIARALDVYRDYCFNEREIDPEHYRKDEIAAHRIHAAIIEVNHNLQISEREV